MPEYCEATRRIGNPMHIGVFKSSPACQHIKGFIGALTDAVKGMSASDKRLEQPSEAIAAAVALLDNLNELVTNTPPENAALRFGNPAFKTFHAILVERAPELIKSLLPEGKWDAVVELTPYLLDSFGNATRLDYGSGHELHFVAFLCCITMLGVFTEKDSASLVLVVFKQYLDLVRRIQVTYKLEPAGSHGVWGLDDHQFLCYLWGASQLVGSTIEPNDIPEDKAAEEFGDDFLFFGAVRHIKKVKRGPFFEHSRYLFDISGVPSWTKISKGLGKMFDAEVLYKFPVVQHFLFGSLLEISLAPLPKLPSKAETKNG